MKKIAALLSSATIAFSAVSALNVNAVSTELIVQQGASEVQASDTDLLLFPVEVAKLVNKERVKNGLAPLKMFPRLNKAAKIRAEETAEFWSHRRPDGREAFTVIDDVGLKWNAVGENIACGQTTPQAVVSAWMNSQDHKDNILNRNYKYIGVGIANINGRYYWTQNFVGMYDTYPGAYDPDQFGDVNGDGVIDSVDASLLLKDYASVSSGHGYTLTTFQRAKSDLTADDKMDSVDASSMLRLYAKNST